MTIVSFITLEQAKTELGIENTSISTVVFTGFGLNDASSSGVYTGSGVYSFEAIIDHESTGPTDYDTFKWRKGPLGSYTEGVVITGAVQLLSNGVYIKYNARIGHTLSDKSVISVSGDGTQDTKISERLEEITAMIQKHCHRNFFVQEDISELKDGDNSIELFLDEYPVQVINTITINDLEILERTTIFDTGFVLYADQGKIIYGGGFPFGYQNIVVDYDAGYDDDDMPKSLQMATKNWLKETWYSPESSNIESEKTPGGYQVTYRKDRKEIDKVPFSVRGLLEPFVRKLV